MNDKEARKKEINRTNGLSIISQYANDALVFGKEELRAHNQTRQGYFRESVLEIMGWSGLSIEEVKNPSQSDKGKYAKEVLESLQDL